MRTETVELTYYTFDELSDAAKENAREWFREGHLDYDWWECVYSDFIEICECLGVETTERGISFSGFWSQGDGASFTGSYNYKKGAAKAVREYAPEDTELHRIADALQEIQRRNMYQLTASISKSGRYEHSGTMRVSVDRDAHNYQDATADAEDTIQDAMRDLADWLYKRLEREYEYQMSDEQIDEGIRANEYEFDAHGATV